MNDRTPLGIADADAKPGDIMIIGLPFDGKQSIPVFGIDGASMQKADDLFGAGSRLALAVRRDINDEAARRIMAFLDPMSWFET